MNENLEELIEKYNKDIILYLEESGFYEDIENSKLTRETVYTKQVNFLNENRPIRVMIIKASDYFSLTISSTSPIRSKRLSFIGYSNKAPRKRIINENVKFLNIFVDAYISCINNREKLDSVFNLNRNLIMLNNGIEYDKFAETVYICIGGNRKTKNSTAIHFDLMSSEFPREIYDYCIKYSLNIPEDLKKMFE